MPIVDPSRVASRLEIIGGAVLLALGATVVFGWILRIPIMVQFVPGMTEMVFNTSLCFIIAGGTLLGARISRRNRANWHIVGGTILILFPGLVLSQEFFGTYRGLDLVWLQAWLGSPNSLSGRMPPNAAIAFISAGFVLVIHELVHSKFVGWLLQFLTLAVIALGALGVAGYGLNFELLYGWYGFTRMAFSTGLGLVLFGVTLWALWYNTPWIQSLYVRKEEQRISIAGGLALLIVALATGIAGFGLMQRQATEALSRSISLALESHAGTFEESVRHAMQFTVQVAHERFLTAAIDNVSQYGSSAAAEEQLQLAADDLLQFGYSAVALHGSDGRVLAQAGRFAKAPELAVPLTLPYEVMLLWDGGMRLRTKVKIQHAGREIGAVVTERELDPITKMLVDVGSMGETAELVFCRADGANMTCFPSRLHAKPIGTIPQQRAGRRLPMSYALEGVTGVVVAADYRRQQVFAAYTPIGTLGVGMVLKLDTAELYKPIRQQLNWVLPILLAIALLGALLLRWQVLPLVRQLIRAEESARGTAEELRQTTYLQQAILDSANYSIISVDTAGRIVTFNSGAERMLGYSASEVIGQKTPEMFHDPEEIRTRARELSAELGRDFPADFGVFTAKAREGKLDEKEWTFIRKDGTRFPVQLSVTALRDEASNITGFLGIASDITERKAAALRLQAQEKFLIDAIDSLAFPTFVIDSRHRVMVWNRACEELTGISASEIVGTRDAWKGFYSAQRPCLADLVVDGGFSETSFYQKLWPSKFADGGIHSEGWFDDINGRKRYLLFDAAPIYDASGRLIAAVESLLDLTDRKKTEDALQQNHDLLAAIREAQGQLIRDNDPRQVFDGLLNSVLTMTGSEYGFIGEVRRSSEGKRFLKTFAMTNIAWDDDTRALYRTHEAKGFEFHNTETLFGAVLKTGELVIANEPGNDPRRGGTPHGHPPLKAFMGLPVYSGDEMVGMIGLANRPEGYTEELVEFLQPFMTTCANIIRALRHEQMRKRAIEDLNRFKGVLDETLDMIYMFEPGNLQFVYVNRGAVAATGYRRDQLLTLTPGDILPDMPLPRFNKLVAPLRAGAEGALSFDTVLRRNDGTEFPVEIHVQLVRQDEGEGLFIAIVRDISERQKIDRMKNEFVSTVSHELRTPLTSIRGSLGLLTAGVAGVLPDQAKHLIQIAHNNSERLVRLINDILDIEKIESGKIKFDLSVYSLSHLVEAAIEANRGYANQFNVALELIGADEDSEGVVDADRFAQVMANLLSNAIKFSPPGEKVTVSVARHGATVRVMVKDRGPGIPEEFREKVFQKFTQADSSDTRQKGGTGLGLSIAKAIIERMGGEIGFDSRSGEGTTFYCDLPYLGEQRLPCIDEMPGRGNRILICEDDPDIARLLELLLSEEGFESDIALNATEAKRMLSEREYRVMTLDLQLPDQDGISLIRELRGRDETRNLPIVVVSATAAAGREKLNGGGFAVVDWLEKPINPERLAYALRCALRGHGERRPRVLHVEDDADVRQVVASLGEDIADFDWAATVADADDKLSKHDYDLVILDLGLPDGNGRDLLPRLKKLSTPPPVVVFSASDMSTEEARGVAAALVKTHTNNDELLRTVTTLVTRNHRARSTD